MPGDAFVDISDARIWTATSGDGPPLVLCHGGPGLWDALEDVAAAVDDLVTVHRYDQRGCGRSEGPPADSVEAAVADLDALREHWGYERWAVGGHSWGANLALAYALEHPQRVTALLYLCGTGPTEAYRDAYRAARDTRLTPEESARLAVLQARLPEVTGTPEFDAVSDELCRLQWSTDFADRGRAAALVQRLLHPTLRPNYAVNAALNAGWKRYIRELGTARLLGRLGALDVPALVLHGADDPRPVRVVSELASQLPRGRLVVMPGTGHYPWLEAPEAFRTHVREFVALVRP